MNKTIVICVILLEATVLASIVFGDMDIYYLDDYETHLEAHTFDGGYIHLFQKSVYIGKELSWGFPYIVLSYISLVVFLTIVTYWIFLYWDKRDPLMLKVARSE